MTAQVYLQDWSEPTPVIGVVCLTGEERRLRKIVLCGDALELIVRRQLSNTQTPAGLPPKVCLVNALT
jgi:hypothetical protein